jgi:hypothetical protein
VRIRSSRLSRRSWIDAVLNPPRRYLLEIASRGWHLVDHDAAAMRTKERVGHWGPTLLDVAILSLGKLFVGG